MNYNTLSKILELLKDDNHNYYINNQGLAALGQLLFYPNEKQKSNATATKAKALFNEFYTPESKEKLFESLQKYHFSSYYTPLEVIQFQLDLLDKSKIKPKRILEPSAGNGAYVQELKKKYPDSEIIALEPDILSYEILKRNNLKNKNVTCINTSFENYILTNPKPFDLIISNIPFGDINIENSHLHKSVKTAADKNVNTFFIKNAPLLLNDKGFTFFLTSSTFLDKKTNNDIKKELLSTNDLIQSLRFNNSLFKETKVVTDLLLLQRNNSKKTLSNTEKTLLEHHNTEINNTTINLYYHQNPNLINGDIAPGYFNFKKGITFIKNKENINTFLKKQLQNITLPPITFSEKETKTTLINTAINTATANVINPHGTKSIKTNTQKPTDGAKNNLEFNSNSYPYITILNHKPVIYKNSGFYLPVKTKNQSLAIDYIMYRDTIIAAFKKIVKNNIDTDNTTIANSTAKDKKMFAETISYQESLFNFKHQDYDYIKKDFFFKIFPDNSNFFHYNAETYLKHLHNYYLTNTVKELELNQNKGTESNKTTQADTAWQSKTTLAEISYAYYDRYGYLNLDAISKAYKKTPEETIRQAYKEKIFFYNPISKNEINQNLKEKYKLTFFNEIVSGDILYKINFIQKNPLPYNLDNTEFAAFLNKEKAPIIPINDITFNFESHFIPLSIKKQFFLEEFSESIIIVNSQFNNLVKIEFAKTYNLVLDNLYSVKSDDGNTTFYSYKKIISDFANNKIPLIKKSIKNPKTDKIDKIILKKETLIAHNKLDNLSIKFQAFIKNNVAYSRQIEQNYYNLFIANKNLNSNFNQKILTYPNTLKFEPYKHQREAVLFALQKGTALFDHEVGHGKTTSMGMLAYKLNQHQKAKRSLIATLKPVAEQLFEEIKTQFPELNPFLITTNNIKPAAIEETLLKIKNDPSIKLIVAEHSHLLKLKTNPKYEEAILTEKINMISQDLNEAIKFGLKKNKSIIKGLEKRKQNFIDKLNNKRTHINNNLNHVNFEKKQLYFEDLNIEALLIDESHLFKNISYTTRHGDVSGLNKTDGSAKSLDLEYKIKSIHNRKGADKNVFFFTGTPLKNSVVEVYALQRYLTPAYLKEKKIANFDSWASIFLKQSSELEADIFGTIREHKRFRYFTNLPELSLLYNSFSHISNSEKFKTHNITINDNFTVLEPTPNLLTLRAKSMDFAKNKDQIALFGYEKYDPDSLKATFITALQLNRSALIDPFLIESTIDFTSEDQVKLHQIAADAAKYYNQYDKEKGVVLIFSNIGVFKNNAYNSYETIKNILMDAYQIPAAEISFAQQNKGSKNKKFQENIRQGNLRIVFGSTSVLGTGNNIQNKICAILHLDIPFTPDEIIQRNGRGARVGNLLLGNATKILNTHSYGYKNTTDIFSYSLGKHKALFQKQLKDTTSKIRVYDNTVDDDKNLSFSQKEAALIGNMDLFELRKFENQLNLISQEKQYFELSKSNALQKITTLEFQNKALISKINYLEKTKNIFNPLITPFYDANNKALSSIQIARNIVTNMLTVFDFEQNPKLRDVLSLLPPKTPPESLSDKDVNTVYNALSNYINAFIVDLQKNQNLKATSTPLFFSSYYSIYFEKNFNETLKKFNFNLVLSHPESKIKIKTKPQYSYNLKKTPLLFSKLIEPLHRDISSLTLEFNMNKKSIELNKSLLTQKFPEEKLKNIQNIETKIVSIKRKMKMH